jgi:hypothetical protein
VLPGSTAVLTSSPPATSSLPSFSTVAIVLLAPLSAQLAPLSTSSVLNPRKLPSPTPLIAPKPHASAPEQWTACRLECPDHKAVALNEALELPATTSCDSGDGRSKGTRRDKAGYRARWNLPGHGRIPDAADRRGARPLSRHGSVQRRPDAAERWIGRCRQRPDHRGDAAAAHQPAARVRHSHRPAEG